MRIFIGLLLYSLSFGISACLENPVAKNRALIASSNRAAKQNLENFRAQTASGLARCQKEGSSATQIETCKATVELQTARNLGIPPETTEFLVENAKLRIAYGRKIDSGVPAPQAIAEYEIARSQLLAGLQKENDQTLELLRSTSQADRLDSLRPRRPIKTECSTFLNDIRCTSY